MILKTEGRGESLHLGHPLVSTGHLSLKLCLELKSKNVNIKYSQMTCQLILVVIIRALFITADVCSLDVIICICNFQNSDLLKVKVKTKSTSENKNQSQKLKKIKNQIHKKI